MSVYNKMFRKEHRNIYNYLYDYGDVSFQEMPFNELDALIMGVLSYVPFEQVVGDEMKEPVTLKDLIVSFLGTLNVDYMSVYYPDFTFKHILLCLKLLTAKRFCDSKVVAFQKVHNEEKKIQFCGIAVILEDGTLNVSYRGTDNTFVGWEENFAIAFSDHVPGQALATAFLMDAMKAFPNVKVRVFGHSKGGNFAVCSAVSIPKKEQDKIINVYSLDGLGICRSLFESEEHKRIEKRIIHIVPEQSVIGCLLCHEKISFVVKSYPLKEVFNQHDIYNWVVSDTECKLVRSTLLPMGKYITKSFNEVVAMTKDSSDFDLLMKALIKASDILGYHTPDDAFANSAKVVQTVMSMPMPKDDRRRVNNILRTLLNRFNVNRPEMRRAQAALDRKKKNEEAKLKREKEEKEAQARKEKMEKQRLLDQIAADTEANIRKGLK